MSLESLGDFLSRSGKGATYERALVAFKLAERIEQETGLKVKVVMRGQAVSCICANTAEAAALRFQTRTVLTIYREVTGQRSQPRLIIKSS
jgi:hypothetical protein